MQAAASTEVVLPSTWTPDTNTGRLWAGIVHGLCTNIQQLQTGGAEKWLSEWSEEGSLFCQRGRMLSNIYTLEGSGEESIRISKRQAGGRDMLTMQPHGPP